MFRGMLADSSHSCVINQSDSTRWLLRKDTSKICSRFHSLNVNAQHTRSCFSFCTSLLLWVYHYLPEPVLMIVFYYYPLILPCGYHSLFPTYSYLLSYTPFHAPVYPHLASIVLNVARGLQELKP